MCRLFEQARGLRCLRTPQQAKAARKAGGDRPHRGDARRRHNRTGTEPLIERADALRLALDAPDWQAKQRRLDGLDVDLMPVIKPTKTDPGRVRGLVLIDRHDEGNRVRASDLDQPDRHYGLRKIEARHDASADRFEVWWANHRSTTKPRASDRSGVSPADPRHAYRRYLEEHRAQRQADAAERALIRKRQARERKALQRKLAAERRALAEALPADARRTFYTIFSVTRRKPALDQQVEVHALELERFRVKRRSTWAEYLASATVADCGQERTPEPQAESTRAAVMRDVADDTLSSPATDRESDGAPGNPPNSTGTVVAETTSTSATGREPGSKSDDDRDIVGAPSTVAAIRNAANPEQHRRVVSSSEGGDKRPSLHPAMVRAHAAVLAHLKSQGIEVAAPDLDRLGSLLMVDPPVVRAGRSSAGRWRLRADDADVRAELARISQDRAARLYLNAMLGALAGISPLPADERASAPASVVPPHVTASLPAAGVGTRASVASLQAQFNHRKDRGRA